MKWRHFRSRLDLLSLFRHSTIKSTHFVLRLMYVCNCEALSNLPIGICKREIYLFVVYKYQIFLYFSFYILTELFTKTHQFNFCKKSMNCSYSFFFRNYPPHLSTVSCQKPETPPFLPEAFIRGYVNDNVLCL